MNGFPLNLETIKPEAVSVVRASEYELPLLVKISEYAFITHSVNMSPYEAGGPKGYDSILWHRKALTAGSLYKICAGNQILGAVYYSIKKKPHSGKIADTAWINRVFIHPEAQNKGIGRRVFQIIEQQNPQIRIWGLDTPAWAVDNLQFYHSMAYRQKEIRYIGEEGFDLVILEKRMDEIS